jgi:GNAT superfamily N-acetyltransferase
MRRDDSPAGAEAAGESARRGPARDLERRMSIVWRILGVSETLELADRLAAVYRDAFGAPPYSKGAAEAEDFIRSLPRHARMDGFRITVALQGESDCVVGFAYGYHHGPDQSWHRWVAEALPARMVAQWLEGSFRLVEMAVTPAAQGKGIGGRLHDRLLRGIPYRKAVLSTMAAQTRASEMYRKRGWVMLLDNHFFPGVSRPYRVMGLDLCRWSRCCEAQGT